MKSVGIKSERYIKPIARDFVEIHLCVEIIRANRVHLIVIDKWSELFVTTLFHFFVIIVVGLFVFRLFFHLPLTSGLWPLCLKALGHKVFLHIIRFLLVI